jgi:hypothetical protein
MSCRARQRRPARVDFVRWLNEKPRASGQGITPRSHWAEVTDIVPNFHGNVDGVSCAVAIPLMDAPRAVAGWMWLLKSSEISATWFYGRPLFPNNDKVKAIYVKIFDRLSWPS